MFSVIKAPNHPVFSVFIPFTRLWVVERFLLSLEAMELDKPNTELIFYNDTRDEALQKALEEWLQTFGQDFNGAGLYQSGKQLPNEFDVAYRRERICAMKENSKTLLSDSSYVFCLEDDTIAPPNSFKKLLKLISSDNNLAVVSGVEVGRWAIPTIGAGELDSLEDPQRYATVPYRASGVQNVDTCGWYCYMTPTALYKAAHYRQASEVLGPCETYTWDQRRAGYEALIDWELPCEHILEDGTSLIPNENNDTVIWNKTGSGWIMKDFPVKVILQDKT